MPAGLSAGAIAAIGAGVSAAGSVAGSAINSSAAAAGSKAQQAASNSALAQQQAQFTYNQTLEQPYIGAGQVAQQSQNDLFQQYEPIVDNLQNQLLGLGDSQTAQAFLEQTPGYQFNLTQGLKATQNAAAARGLGVSGAAMKGAASYATGLANSTYQQQYSNASNNLTQANNTFQGLFGDYGSQASLGENAAVGAGNQGQAASNNTSNLLTSQGNAQAASSIAQGNAATSGATGISTALQGYQNNQLLQNYLGTSGSQYGGGAGTPGDSTGGTFTQSAGNSLTGSGIFN